MPHTFGAQAGFEGVGELSGCCVRVVGSHGVLFSRLDVALHPPLHSPQYLDFIMQYHLLTAKLRAEKGPPKHGDLTFWS